MMADFQIRADSVDVEQIMQQIRSRIREKRGADYTEDEIRALANAKLEKFLDPSGVRSDLLEHFRRARRAAQETGERPMNFVFEDTTLFESPRPLLRWIRNMLKPVLRLFFNYNRLSHVLHQQAIANAQFHSHEDRRRALDGLYYEVMHNLVLETTRLGIEVKNLRMRLESISSRLDFDERRARALEGVVQYRPSVLAATSAASLSAGTAASQPSPQSGPRPSGQPAGPTDTAAGIAERRARRRRRRGRRRGGQGAPGASGAPGAGASGALGADTSDAEADEREALDAHDAPSAPAPRAPDAANAPDAPDASHAPDRSDPEE
jgi:hypothetical protein